MNKLTKIGATALCGSLAAVSAAYAGSLSVAGGATVTYSSNEGTTNGNPIGMNSGMTFTGSGELDNGTTFTLTLTQADQTAYSSGNVALTVPSFGKITLDQGVGGSGIDRYDDKMPTAWEESNGTSLGSGLNTVGGVSGAANIDWAIDAGMLPDGMTAAVAWAPRNSGSNINDKATGGSAGEGKGQGFDIALSYTGVVDGLEVFGGWSTIDQATSTSGYSDDQEQVVIGATYAIGSVTVGYQYSKDDKGLAASGTTYYENDAFGISFQINDDLAVSYGEHDSEKGVNGTGATNTLTTKSLQVSYTMGGMGIKIAESSVSNQYYVSTTTHDRDGTTVALTLAF